MPRRPFAALIVLALFLAPMATARADVCDPGVPPDPFRSVCPVADCTTTVSLDAEHYRSPAAATNAIDAYTTASSGDRPAILFIHGGGWSGGIKGGAMADEAERVACDTGFAVFNMEYRTKSTQMWVDEPQDVRDALQWIRDHAGTYDVDVDRIGMYGQSAGGHLALLVGLEDGASSVRAVAAWGGPTDLTSAVMEEGCALQPCLPNRNGNQQFLGRAAQNFLGGCTLAGCYDDSELCPGDDPNCGNDPKAYVRPWLTYRPGSTDCPGAGTLPCKPRYAEASPSTHVDADDPAVFQGRGVGDILVPLAQLLELHALLRASGVYTELEIGIGTLTGPDGPAPAGHEPPPPGNLRDIEQFFELCLLGDC